MKKGIVLLMCFCMLFGMIACGGGETAGAGETTTAAPTKPAPTVQVVEGQPVEQLDDVSVYIPVAGPSKELEGLPAYVYSEGAVVAYRGEKAGRYGLNTHIIGETDAAAFITYLNALEADGWVQYSNNIMDGTNLFATYTKDAGSIYCYYISSKRTAYLVSSPEQKLEPRQQDNQYEAICKPQLTQIKLLNKEWRGGMSYLLRLSDGRFIMIDGGYNEQDFYHARQLYALMEEQNVLDNITIAAWIITHPHIDHLGTAADFLRYYKSNQVELQQMIFNFPTDDDIMKFEPESVTSDHPSYMPTFMLALDILWPELTITVCHTGQRYHFADATIEVLHTLEDFYPKTMNSLSSNQMNGASVVFSLEVGGQKTMFLADSAEDCSKDLYAMWGDYLKSDMMQAAHHGLRGGTVDLYKAIDPEVVLVPMYEGYMNKILDFDASRWVWNNGNGRIREVILSGWQQRTLELPYLPAPGTEFFSNATTDPWAGMEAAYKTNP